MSPKRRFQHDSIQSDEELRVINDVGVRTATDEKTEFNIHNLMMDDEEQYTMTDITNDYLSHNKSYDGIKNHVENYDENELCKKKLLFKK
jgi:hypothetical protein